MVVSPRQKGLGAKTMTEIDFEGEAFKPLIQRALENHNKDEIASLSKAEAVFYVSGVLTGDVPDGGPETHNGNATKTQLKEWSAIIRNAQEDGVDFEQYRPDEEDEEDNE